MMIQLLKFWFDTKEVMKLLGYVDIILGHAYIFIISYLIDDILIINKCNCYNIGTEYMKS